MNDIDNSFTSVNGVNYIVVPPSEQDLNAARSAYQNAYHKAVLAKVHADADVLDMLRQKKQWSDGRQKELERVASMISEREAKLHCEETSAGEKVELEASVKRLTKQHTYLLRNVVRLRAKSCEGRAIDAAFGTLMCRCFRFAKTDACVFRDFAHYNANRTKAYVEQGARVLAAVWTGNLDYLRPPT